MGRETETQIDLSKVSMFTLLFFFFPSIPNTDTVIAMLNELYMVIYWAFGVKSMLQE